MATVRAIVVLLAFHLSYTVAQAKHPNTAACALRNLEDKGKSHFCRLAFGVEIRWWTFVHNTAAHVVEGVF